MDTEGGIQVGGGGFIVMVSNLSFLNRHVFGQPKGYLKKNSTYSLVASWY